jgi:hypothetical protein
MESCQKGLKSVNAKMMMSVSIVKRGSSVMAIYRWLRGLINPLSMEHRAEYVARTIRRILEFLQL